MATNDGDGDNGGRNRGLNPVVLRTLAEVHGEFRRFLQRTLRDDDAADDVMQDFYARVLARSWQLRREESVRVWLRRVLRSVLNDHLRRRAARWRAEADFARRDAAVPPQERAVDSLVCMCMGMVLPALKAEYAEVLRRVDLENEPRTRVAESLRLPVGTVNVRLYRARRALRRALELACETCPIHGYLDCGCAYTRRLRSRRRATG